ncbi:MarR family winged helix-turn-helix transcriptional regulator [Parageobacillus thermoglucosidasius]|uniref:MarR family transcriptional regulator n=2 Tax=Anoxybacillaceae TaxID=3120669 RepID=A0AB38QVW1_PARTM|nr:MarR family transcriptional regulator [Parageobacillus thermoglucosidasius]AEH46935.1 transcriptional regulator, MarR family [Parageobacillus thermoglucosidasius C56-YS93]MBY6268855.1 MarR family transcriptional regulator [Parageobacillus thermoglucosidasius]MED4903794.1 MarR family transcriptional regulator [Parageobacillus thermoglucosidasius]MED4912536.1 MarR family transcriptional regulator [Parageobacillus thermoglucosidasius]MED4944328.1 MarR family transcriptional regulator [Parageob
MRYGNIDDLVERYLSVFFIVMRKATALVQCELDEDMTNDQYYLLRDIKKKGKCTSTELASVFGVSKSAITAMTNRLVEKGLLQRTRDPNDRRVVYLTLTEHGDEWIAKAEDKVHKLVESLIAKFSEEEIEAFIQTYEKFARILQEMEGAP